MKILLTFFLLTCGLFAEHKFPTHNNDVSTTGGGSTARPEQHEMKVSKLTDMLSKKPAETMKKYGKEHITIVSKFAVKDFDEKTGRARVRGTKLEVHFADEVAEKIDAQFLKRGKTQLYECWLMQDAGKPPYLAVKGVIKN